MPKGERLMELLLFIVFSLLEYFAIFLFIFAWFNFPIRYYIGKIIFVTVFITLTSYFFRYTAEMGSLGVFIPIVIQWLVLICAFRFVFEVQWYYAFILTIFPWSAYGLLQTVIYVAFKHLGILNVLVDLQNKSSTGLSLVGYVLQLVSSVVAYLIAFSIVKAEKGFTFIPEDKQYVWHIKDNVLLAFMIGVIIIFTLTSGLFFNEDLLVTIVGIHSLIIIASYILLRKRERYEHQHN